MPIPTPSEGEKRDGFIARCMSNDVMKSEFPDNKQRVAVCSKRWEAKKEKDAQQEEIEEMQQLPEQRLGKIVKKLNEVKE